MHGRRKPSIVTSVDAVTTNATGAPSAAGTNAPPSDPAAIVRRAYRAFARRDLRDLGGQLADAVTLNWNVPGAAESVHGREAILDQLAALINATGGTASAELVELYSAAGGRVVTTHRETGRLGGVELDRTASLIIDLDGDGIRLIERLEPAPPARRETPPSQPR